LACFRRRSLGFTQFKVDFTPSKSVGTYSYTVGRTTSPIASARSPARAGAEQCDAAIDRCAQAHRRCHARSHDICCDAGHHAVHDRLNSAPAGFIVGDVNVSVTLNHTFDSQLELYLISPSLLKIRWRSTSAGAGDNFTGTIFDDQASQSIAAAAAAVYWHVQAGLEQISWVPALRSAACRRHPTAHAA